MGSWADESEDSTPQNNDRPAESSSSEPPRRKRLQLKPRSATASTSASTSASGKSNPFGAAKPREQVLASKGIDAKSVDDRIQKKATVIHFSKDQDAEIQEVQGELSRAEGDLRNANEQELPEEKYRVLAEEKKRELTEMMEKFTLENTEKNKQRSEKSGGAQKFERPSERRRRLDEEGGRPSNENNSNSDAFANFGGRRQQDDNDYS